MKILVLSDTHGAISEAEALIKSLNPDYVFHLGDMAEDSRRLEGLFPRKIITSVKGNNDYFCKEYPLERVFNLGSIRFFMCHGHKYNVKSSLLPLKYKAQELGARVALFGHTHIPFLDIGEELIMLNPGSCGSYGIIETDGENIDAGIHRYKK